MLYKTKRAIMWIATIIFTIIVLCWVFYIAYVDFAVNDANIKSEQYQKAFQQWSGSAAEGDTISQYRLGEMHEKGLGVPRNVIEAHVWYQLSANGGLDAGNAALERLQTNMSQEQVVEAEKLRNSYANVLTAGAKSTALTPNASDLNQSVALSSAQLNATSTQTVSSNQTMTLQPSTELATTGVTAVTQPVAQVGESSAVSASLPSDTAVQVQQQQTSLAAVGTVVPTATADETALKQQSVLSTTTNQVDASDDGTPVAQPVDNQTRTEVIINTAVNATDNSSPSLSVCEAQQMLSQLGFNVGTIDGLFGSQTSGAITEYQRTYGLTETGVIDRPLIASLLGLPWDGASIRAFCSNIGA